MSEALLSLGAESEIHLMWVNERVRSYRKKQKVGLVRPTSSLHHLKSQREAQSIRGSEDQRLSPNLCELTAAHFSLKRLLEALCVVSRWKRSCVVWGHFLLVLAQRQPAGEEANEELHHCHGLRSPTDSYTCPSFSQRGAKGEHRRLRLPASPVRWFELSWLRLMPRMVRITPTPPRQRGLLRLNAFMLTAVLHQPVETTVIQNPAFPQESSSAGVCALSHSLTQLWQMWGQSRTWVEVGRGYYDEM